MRSNEDPVQSKINKIRGNKEQTNGSAQQHVGTSDGPETTGGDGSGGAPSRGEGGEGKWEQSRGVDGAQRCPCVARAVETHPGRCAGRRRSHVSPPAGPGTPA